MDMNQKGSESEEISITSPGGDPKEPKRSCVDCHTTRTPLWRGGPAGPRSLCNACGIRYRKQRKAYLGTEQSRKKRRRRRREMVLKRRKLGEEEQAAILLMALSCGYV